MLRAWKVSDYHGDCEDTVFGSGRMDEQLLLERDAANLALLFVSLRQYNAVGRLDGNVATDVTM